ncbi:MAG TPA: response regulator [Bryobacterales bacterium]|jgi:DNA-binding response OmpR family regulator|nr:response regulator [Bryobacterales bacterium]
MKILIADDEPVSRRMLEWLVRKNGDEPVVLANGSLAGWLLQRDDAPRVAILDWLMPGLDGIQICRLLRSRTDRPYTYILLVTSKTQKEDLVRGLEAGADDYITKPFDPDELNLRINVGRRVAEVQDRLLSQINDLRRRLAVAEPAGRFAARAACLNPLV